MEIKWTDLRPGDVLTFTPEFIRHANEDLNIREWFVEEIVRQGNPPPSFPIKEVRLNGDLVVFRFYWEREDWSIKRDGSLAHESSDTPRVFDVVELVGEE